AQGRVEPTTFGDRCRRIVREMRIDFDADKTVARVRRVVDRAHEIGGIAYVAQRDGFESLLRRPTFARAALDQIVIIIAGGNRFLKNGWVRGEARDAFVDQSLQLAGAQQIAADE